MKIKKFKLILITMVATSLLSGVAFAGLADGLIAYWPFNGNANDVSGNKNHGSVFEATLCESRFGSPDSAYCFDGINDQIDIGNNVKPSFPVTVSSWIKVNELHSGVVFRNDRVDSSSYRYGLGLYVIDSGQIMSIVFQGFSAPWNRVNKKSNDSVIETGRWHHFAVILLAYDDMHLFFDGVEIDGYYEGTGSSMQYSDGNGAIGKETPNQYSFNGGIDDTRVYNRALSDEEIVELFEFGPRWPELYTQLFDAPSDITLMRQYRDKVLSRTKKGRIYKKLLYKHSDEAIGVLLSNPELVLQAKNIINTNTDAVSEILDGYEGIIYNTEEIAAFLDAYAREAPFRLKLLTKMVKRHMLRQQRRGKLFFGFRLE
jgi:hypothetical protein